ncbi:MAG: M23 family metallopeptidase [Oligoflexia bacterium]|nr:M23 family metallopeptidase [Oligoflexia bacterium]
MRGWADLILLVGVLAACWTRTPIGAAMVGVVSLAQGRPTPDLLASFRTEVPAALQRSLERAVALKPAEPGPRPGWSLSSPDGDPALTTAIQAHLGPEALAQVQALGLASPEAALEIWAVGRTPRDRAIARARAAGLSAPESFEAHRRFLPSAAAARANRAVGETLALATVLDLSWPVDPGTRISSGFGYRTHPILGTRKLHEGVDLAVPLGTDVFAAGSGRVLRARHDKICGNGVKLDHGHGVSTSYCHGQKLFVQRGQRVEQGQRVMASGSTGRSTGPHLHFGLRIGGHPVDPSPFRARGAVADAQPQAL